MKINCLIFYLSNQQKIALKLYKQTNKMMYCFWNAASYVMMAQEDSTGQLTPQEAQQKGKSNWRSFSLK